MLFSPARKELCSVLTRLGVERLLIQAQSKFSKLDMFEDTSAAIPSCYLAMESPLLDAQMILLTFLIVFIQLSLVLVVSVFSAVHFRTDLNALLDLSSLKCGLILTLH